MQTLHWIVQEPSFTTRGEKGRTHYGNRIEATRLPPVSPQDLGSIQKFVRQRSNHLLGLVCLHLIEHHRLDFPEALLEVVQDGVHDRYEDEGEEG